MKHYLLYALLLLLPYITRTTAIDGETLWSLSARICAEVDESLSKLCVIDSTLDNLDFDLEDEISFIEEVICSKIDELEDCFMITQEDINAGFTISISGKYCLVENVTHTSASAAITISADEVTLNLGGHTIDGTSTATIGITTSGTRENITIQNGSVTSTGTSHGISIASTTRLCIANIISINNNSSGILVSSCNNVIVKDCITKNNGVHGISFLNSNNNTAKNCISQINTSSGFHINNSNETILIDCKAIENTVDGFTVSGTTTDTIFCQCLAVDNSADGFEVSDGSSSNTSLIHNKSTSNTTNGFVGNGTTSAFANLAHSNGTDYSGITDPIEGSPGVTTGFWANVDQ